MEKEEVITMVECPNCHQELSSINKFCTRCGAVLDASVAKGPSYQQPEPGVVMYTCPKCQNVYNMSNKFCPKCGNPTNPDDENAIIEEQPQKVMSIMFEPGVELPEDQMLDRFIKNQMAVLGIENGTKLIPISVLRRKKIMNIIISILVFVYVSMIFIHFPLATYIVGLIILIICLKSFNRYDFMKYLIKQIKARPNEKISNIIMNETNDLVVDNSGFIKAIGMILAVILPCVIFFKPVIIYEKMDGGYGVRYYAWGLTNFTTATIPETHNGEKVISLRGNTFSNMPFLTKVTLPDSIIEIRGQAFKNCFNLKEVNMPKSLVYLGGGAFNNATSIEAIELPDTLTILGGEAFLGATNLRYVKLSENLEEIRGNTFENCKSLESIVIPDSVTRIGGHAFYGDSSLSSVSISRNSKLVEIGSSAFRQCGALFSITIPKSVTNINYRAFKESPTRIEYYDSSDKQYNFAHAKEVSSTSYEGLNVGEPIYFKDLDLYMVIESEYDNSIQCTMKYDGVYYDKSIYLSSYYKALSSTIVDCMTISVNKVDTTYSVSVNDALCSLRKIQG